MEIFFNELSIRPAATDAEARSWLEELARLGALLKQIIESLQEDSFTFRRREDFAEMPITPSRNVRTFLTEEYGFSEPVYIFLLGIFDSPYIEATDPKHPAFEYTSVEWEGAEHAVAGLGAAFIKNSMAVSLNSGPFWDTCTVSPMIHQMDAAGIPTSAARDIRHASQVQHVTDCQLEFLAELFDWDGYHPRFNSTTREHNLLPLLELYSLQLPFEGDAASRWREFYQHIAQLDERERIALIESVADHIAKLQKWEPAAGTLASANRNRTLYKIPGSDLIAGLDTQHGEFEIHRNRSGNNHEGALSLDGKRIKPRNNSRSLDM
ncbi:MAG: hypothetical protein NW241_15890 [Bacteroidia bacterium]|nr:hypothetical protein [Bacteroidia bacterium]